MSTHNIGFYEDLTKIIFELSSNIIKYPPYFFCCKLYKPGIQFLGHRQTVKPVCLIWGNAVYLQKFHRLENENKKLLLTPLKINMDSSK